MFLLSERLSNLEESPIVIFTALANKCDDVVSLSTGSPGHGAIPQIQTALHQVGSRYVCLYRTPHFGSLQARKSAARYFEQRYGLEFDPESEINLTTGFTHLFHCLCTALINPGDVALFIEPFFPQYEQPLALAGGKMVVIPTNESEQWKPQPEAIRNAFSHHPAAKLITFNYPNNPSGATLTLEDWNAIIDVLIEEIEARNASNAPPFLVLADEAYAPLFHHGHFSDHPTLGRALFQRFQNSSLSEADRSKLHQLMDCLLIVCSLSKQGAGGTLLGLGASKNTDLLRVMRIPQKATVINSNAMGELALEAMIQPDSSKTLQWAVDLYKSRLEQLAYGLNEIFEKHGLTNTNTPQQPAGFIPNAGMYLYTNFSHLKGCQITPDFREKLHQLVGNRFDLKSMYLDGRVNTNLEIALWLLIEAKVSTVPMGTPENCYLRFSVGLPQALVEANDGSVDRADTEEQGKQLITQAIQRIDQALTRFSG